MTKVFKVWVEIEEYDEGAGVGETVDTPGASVITLDRYEEAWQFAARLNEAGETMRRQIEEGVVTND